MDTCTAHDKIRNLEIYGHGTGMRPKRAKTWKQVARQIKRKREYWKTILYLPPINPNGG